MGYCSILLFLFTASVLFVARSEDDTFQLNDDVLGLIVFKSAIEDPFSHLGSWNEDDNSPCGWRFIKCNNNGRVTDVNLEGLALSGKMGRGLEKLEKLKAISLANNNFTGNINQQLSSFLDLESLNLSHNSFSGNIPTSFANLSSIKFLDLSENLLSGPVYNNMFENYKSLHFISLSRNHLEGPIPSSLCSCTSLNHLNFSKNHFSGDPNLSMMFRSFPRLRTLDLSRNLLSGNVPSGVISRMYNLKAVILQGNKFYGSIPSDIGLCLHLNRFDISDNYFTGALPESFQRLNGLIYLNLANNMLDGDFPSWINKMNSLEHVDFSGNVLIGSISSSIGELESLKYLNLINNKLTGKIPDSLANCTTLSVIKLRGNFFSDSIPKALFELLGLVQLDLSGNELTGLIIPPGSGSIKLFETLESLDLSDNNLSGDFPAQVSLFSKLRYLNLSWNSFQSRLPAELGYLPYLTVLDLRNSGLTGSIPGDICHSSSLEVVQLDGNSLSGPIPSMIGNCSELSLLSLSHNSLSGPIPQSICLLKKLKILKLEYNQLGGEMPQGLGKLDNLLAVNISYNRLIGRLPPGSIFQTLDESAFEGNLGICSPLLKGPCKMNVPKPLVLDPYAYGDQNQDGNDNDDEPFRSSNSYARHHKFLSVSAIVAISASIVIIVGVMMISLINASARKRHAFIEKGLESMCSTSYSSKSGGSLGTNTGKLILFDSKSSPDCMSSSLESVLSKASEIGQGVFGTVYKATLSEGRVLAIKKLVTTSNNHHPEDFDRQVRILSKAKHQNLITLRGYYWSPQIQLLVTDYAPEGSLHAKLHQSGAPLSWSNRFKIMLGIAKGLTHLHHSFRPPIIHYNIKPKNILLDENMNPKISDFGLATLVNKQHMITNRFRESGLGYVAPELACQSVRVNEKCDVFGFGVLILEIVTGRRAVEYGDDNVVILNDHVQEMVEQGNAIECVDHNMGGRYPEDEVLPVIKLALVCTSRVPSSRPSMAEVVQILHVIKTPISEAPH